MSHSIHRAPRHYRRRGSNSPEVQKIVEQGLRQAHQDRQAGITRAERQASEYARMVGETEIHQAIEKNIRRKLKQAAITHPARVQAAIKLLIKPDDLAQIKTTLITDGAAETAKPTEQQPKGLTTQKLLGPQPTTRVPRKLSLKEDW